MKRPNRRHRRPEALGKLTWVETADDAAPAHKLNLNQTTGEAGQMFRAGFDVNSAVERGCGKRYRFTLCAVCFIVVFTV